MREEGGRRVFNAEKTEARRRGGGEREGGEGFERFENCERIEGSRVQSKGSRGQPKAGGRRAADGTAAAKPVGGRKAGGDAVGGFSTRRKRKGGGAEKERGRPSGDGSPH